MWALRLTQSNFQIIGRNRQRYFSNDGDYIPLVEYIQSTTGCRVEGMAFAESTSGKLVEALDEF